MLPQKRDISIQNLTFQYDGPHSETVLDNVNLEIFNGKITAIVGMSGSGKTTLVKLMLGFYPPVKGEVKVGEYNLQNLNTHLWRENCGAVNAIANRHTMQKLWKTLKIQLKKIGKKYPYLGVINIDLFFV